MIADKTLEIANKHEKKRQLDNLKKSLEKLQDCIREEKKSFNSAVVFKKKEMDFKRKHEECQRFYENKANEYHKQIKLCEELLSEVGFNDQLREESVAQLSEENNQLKDTLKELNEKLNTYSFRPNKASLEAEIEQIQAEIDSMSEDFDKIMADTWFPLLIVPHKPNKNNYTLTNHARYCFAISGFGWRLLGEKI